MKGIVFAFSLVAACGGDIEGSTTDANGGGGSADAPGGVGEPANLVGITLAHNNVRAMVDTTGIAAGPIPAMVWDPDLAAHANAYASMCIDGNGDGLIDHSSSADRQNMVG